eukprot:tig00001065_g6744.t1
MLRLARPARRLLSTRADHAAAIVSESARVGRGVAIGSYSIIEDGVFLGDGVRVGTGCVISEYTTIGAGTTVGDESCIGSEPQDRKFAGEVSTLSVGARCRIGARVTMNRGTRGGGGATVVEEEVEVGDGAHVAHDCRVRRGARLGRDALLAGHVDVGEGARLGDRSGVHQFLRLGRCARALPGTALDGHLVPYGVAGGNRAALLGLDLPRLRREGVPRPDARELLQAFRYLFLATPASAPPSPPGPAAGRPRCRCPRARPSPNAWRSWRRGWRGGGGGRGGAGELVRFVREVLDPAGPWSRHGLCLPAGTRAPSRTPPWLLALQPALARRTEARRRRLGLPHPGPASDHDRQQDGQGRNER